MYASFVRSEPLTSDIASFHFRPEELLDHIAGQYIELTLEHDHPDDKGSHRWFTLSSSPTEDGIMISIRLSGSSFKQALQQLKPGQKVHISQPQGDFVLPLDEDAPLIWVAAGIGITPFRSMAAWLADNHEHRQITLFHSVGQPGEALFNNVFDRAGITGRQIIDTSGGQRLEASVVIKAGRQPDTLFYISGPEPFVESFAGSLRQNGVDSYRVISDAFLGYS